MIKIIILFLLILNISSCNITKKNPEIFFKTSKKQKSSDSAIYLSANFYISKGDVYTASKILNTKVDDPKLLQLKFFSNLVSGNFEIARKVSFLLENNLTRHDLFYLPNYILNIKNNEFIKNFHLLKKNKFGQGLSNLSPLIKLWTSKTENKINSKLDRNLQEVSIHELLILENFYQPENLKKLADQIFESKNLNSNDVLLLAGFYFRLKDFKTFSNIVQTKLSNQFDKDFIINNFSLHDNIYQKRATLHSILASKIYNNAILNNQQSENTYIYQKILFEMSLFLCPNLDIAKYSLAELYKSEKTNKLALKKLESISYGSFFFLPSNLKKMSIIKSLGKDYDYKNLLFKNIKKWPKNKFLLYNLATYYKSKKQYLESIKVYRKIINIYGKNDRDLFLYGSNLDKIGKWKDAKVLFLNLLERSPNNTYTLNYVSYKLALKEQNLDLALNLIKQALAVDPENGYFLDTLGWVEFKRKNYNEAVSFLEKSVSILPKSSEVLDHLGDCYLKLNRKSEAIFEWRKSLKYETDKNVIKIIREKLAKYE